MTPEEKSAMRARIFGAPATVTSTASPYFFFDFQFMTRALAAVLAVVLVGGTGVAYAAQGALPGQPLYAVKVDVTEPLQTALAATPAARAAVHVELAQRRVEEAEALSQKGRLDATTTQQLEQNFESHAQSATDLATEVGATDPSAAVEIQAELASSLSVHGALLAAIGTESGSSASKYNAEHLATRVIARADAAEQGDEAPRSAAKVVALAAPAAPTPTAAPVRNVRAFAAMAPTTIAPVATSSGSTTEPTSSEQRESARGNSHAASGSNELSQSAQKALAKAQGMYSDAKDAIDATTTQQLDAQFTQVQTSIDNGDFTTALQLALKLQAILDAQEHYRTNIITPLLDLKFNTNESRRGHGGSGDSHDEGDH